MQKGNGLTREIIDLGINPFESMEGLEEVVK